VRCGVFVLCLLSEKKVELLGEHLKHVKFTKVYSSDYERSVETASTILAKSEQLEVTKLNLQLDERIQELVSFGS